MPLWDQGISGVTKAIAEDQSRRVYVVAGPGTGKTYAMMRRVARLLEEGATPTRVLAVSFTRTAAGDLFRQLDGLNVAGASAVEATTLHSWAFRFLAVNDVATQLARSPRPLLTLEQRALIADLAEAHGGKRAVAKKLQAFEAGWARLQDETPGYPHRPEDQAFEADLLEWLRFHHAMLIGEVIPLALTYLRQNPAALSAHTPYDHVLVDEYQDLNKCEQALVEILATNGTISVIGDDNQSIYRFKHANPEGIRTYQVAFPTTSAHSMTDCRRCPSNVVGMSNDLIAKDAKSTRRPPLLGHSGAPPAEVTVTQYANPDTEAAGVASRIVDWINIHKVPTGEVLVLTPRRAFGNRLRTHLQAKSIAAMSFFGQDPLADTSASKGMALLKLVVNWADVAAMRSIWLAEPNEDTIGKEYRRVRKYLTANGGGLYSTLKELAAGTLRIPHVRQLPALFVKLEADVATLQQLPLQQLIDTIWPANLPECADIRDIASRLAGKANDAQQLHDLLVEEITQPTLPGPQDGIVRIMSLHKSKGLTAQAVAIVGAAAEAIPGSREEGISDADWESIHEEQRRLMYVAVTRAQRFLAISAPRDISIGEGSQIGVKSARTVRSAGGAVFRLSMSPFVSELGPTCPAPIAG